MLVSWPPSGRAATKEGASASIPVLKAVLTLALATIAAAHTHGHHHRQPHHRPAIHYETAVASYYTGIGGACGIDAGREVNGVANLYLPCGKWITVCARSCARVQVVDRGPAAWTGRQYDLTENVAQEIGFNLSAGVQYIRVAR